MHITHPQQRWKAKVETGSFTDHYAESAVRKTLLRLWGPLWERLHHIYLFLVQRFRLITINDSVWRRLALMRAAWEAESDERVVQYIYSFAFGTIRKNLKRHLATFGVVSGVQGEWICLMHGGRCAFESLSWCENSFSLVMCVTQNWPPGTNLFEWYIQCR